MKKYLKAFAKTFKSTCLINMAITALFILAFQDNCLGQQVYAYTDVDILESDVMGYSEVTGSYNNSAHVIDSTSTITSPTGRTATTVASGSSVTIFLSINGEEGWFQVFTDYTGNCPSGSYHSLGDSQGAAQTCADTCTPCRTLRQSQTGTCNINLTQCEGLALTGYIAAINVCENNAFCQENNPNFNEEECNRCKNTATAAFAAATAVCGTIYYQCLGNRVDCETGFYKNTVCTDPCRNP